MIKSKLFSFSLKLGYVSFVHRMWLADTLSPELQTSVPSVKQLCSTNTSTPAMCRSAAQHTTIQDGSGRLCVKTVWSAWAARRWLSRQSSTPSLLTEPSKAALRIAFQGLLTPDTVSSISPFFDHRIQLSFASESNLVSFSWLKWQQAEGPLLGTNPGRLVTLKTYPFN